MPHEETTQTTEGTETSTESTAPWSADLESEFEDPEVRAAVNEFLGKNVQPYVTKIEQEARPGRDATRLWEQFNEDPVSTSIQVTKELYGEEIGDRFAELLQKGSSPEEAAEQIANEQDATAENTETQTETPKEKIKFEDLPPEVQNAIAAQQQEDQKKAYYGEIDRLKTEHADDLSKDEEGNSQLNVDLFHPFVVAANGDFDAAYEGYTKWLGEAQETFGLKVPTTEEAAPNTLNSETRDSATTPPTEKDYGGDLDAAIDDFFADQKTPPPTVGSA